MDELDRRKKAYRAGRARPATTAAAFIVGCQRSGTTMTGRILDRMLEIDGFAETDRRAFRRFRIRGKDVRDRLIDSSDAKCVLFKPIVDSHVVLDLLAEHPGSKALWVYRRWRDVVNSAVQLWGDHWLTVMPDIIARTGNWGWRQEGISDDCHRVIRTLWREGLTAWDAMAVFWYMRNRIYFDRHLDERADILPVQYEALVMEPAVEFRRLCDFLDVTFHPEAVATVFASSIGKAASPVTDPDISEHCDAMLARLDGVFEASRQARV